MKLRYSCIAGLVIGLMSLSIAGVGRAAEFRGEDLLIKDFLVLPRVGRYGRVPIHIDPVQAAMASVKWQSPKAGDEIIAYEGNVATWSEGSATDEGWLESSALRGGYAFAEVTSPRLQVVLLKATGHAMVFVNGEPRAGDPYLTGRSIVPIVLRQGKNELLFHAAAGKLRVTLSQPPQKVFFDSRDNTVPTVVAGEIEPLWVGTLLVNCREVPLENLQITATASGTNRLTSKIDVIPPLSVRKITFPVSAHVPGDITLPATVEVRLSLNQPKRRQPIAETTLELAVAAPNGSQTRTFRSRIDESVQEYQLLRAVEFNAAATNEESPLPGLIVSLHDLGESSREQLAKFTAQEHVHLLAPSGRRTEGCDWENWSARNVLEAIDDCSRHAPFEYREMWLRGTGSGGHGVLRLGGIAPGRWGALIARRPWLEYPAEQTLSVDTPIEAMLERVADANQLAPLLSNTVASGVLIEEAGSQERPATVDSQALFEILGDFHPHFEFRPLGSESAETELREELKFCEKYKAPINSEMDQTDCVTFNPGVNSTNGWLTILGQLEQGSLSRAAVRYEQDQKLFFGLTVNVVALSLDVSNLERDTVVQVVLDGEAVGEFAVDGPKLAFLRNEEGWQLVPALPRSFKRPERYGGLRSAFENRATLVYGTKGLPQENAWAFAKARYDAETLLARMNGSVDVVSDNAFRADSNRDRNVVLYGNADTNSVWPQLLSTSPVQVRRDSVTIDRRPELGDDLACVFVRPRPGNAKAVIGVVSGTGIAGMRATDCLPLFVNGVNFPDVLLFSAKSLTVGNSDVRAAGYFGMGWTVEPGEIVWRDSAL